MNVATVLKSEITPVSRKEVRTELQFLKTTTTKLRSDNAELKRRRVELERLVKQLTKGGANKAVVPGSSEPAGTVARFSGNGLAAQRNRLGLSAADLDKLIGVFGASVYLWEVCKTRLDTILRP